MFLAGYWPAATWHQPTVSLHDRFWHGLPFHSVVEIKLTWLFSHKLKGWNRRPLICVRRINQHASQPIK